MLPSQSVLRGRGEQHFASDNVTRTADRGVPPAPLDSVLSAVRVVLYEPQDPVNIAATIRAMKNMGCSNSTSSLGGRSLALGGDRADTGDIIERIRNCSHQEAARGGVRGWLTARRRPPSGTSPSASRAGALDSPHRAVRFPRQRSKGFQTRFSIARTSL